MSGSFPATPSSQRADCPTHDRDDGWLLTPEELAAALPHAPATALDRRQRPIPWWTQWLEYLDTARGHGGARVH